MKEKKIIQERIDKMKNIEEIKVTVKQPKEEEKLLPPKPVLVYDNAFDNIIEPTQEKKTGDDYRRKIRCQCIFTY